MKTKLLNLVIIFILSLITFHHYGQAPTIGTAANFVLFSITGDVTNSGISQLTGNVGTNGSSSTGFGNVHGVMHDQDKVTSNYEQIQTGKLIAQ